MVTYAYYYYLYSWKMSFKHNIKNLNIVLRIYKNKWHNQKKAITIQKQKTKN